ncbi:MAG: hypothetical protein HY866_09975 [Chloroflexi bacterium]|nr:hypothetical protein [Chloroflexota bacterium]
MRLRRVILALVPAWMRPEDRVLRYVLRQDRGSSNRVTRHTIRLGGGGLVIAVVAMSALSYQTGSPLGMARPGGSALFSVLYFPLVMVQVAALAFALFSTSYLIVSERERGNWEDLKITWGGAEKLVRARWIAVFYQVRGALIIVGAARLIFAGLMLIDLTRYQGYYLDFYVDGVEPAVNINVAVGLVGALLAASLLQFPVWIGLNAALGLLLSTLVRRRATAILFPLVAFGLELIGWVFFMSAGADVLDARLNTVAYTDFPWLSLFGMGTLGDQSLRLMDLQTSAQMWTEVDYGVFLGGALLIALLIEAGLANLLFWQAIRRASAPARE